MEERRRREPRYLRPPAGYQTAQAGGARTPEPIGNEYIVGETEARYRWIFVGPAASRKPVTPLEVVPTGLREMQRSLLGI